MVTLQSSLQYLTGRSIDAAQRGDSRQLHDYMSQYQDIIEEFTDLTDTAGEFDYSESSAQSVVDDFIRDFQLVLTHAIESSNRDCVRVLFNVEGAILRLGVERTNVILCEGFANLFLRNFRHLARTGIVDDGMLDDLMRAFSRPINRIEIVIDAAENTDEVQSLENIMNSLLGAYRDLFWESVNHQYIHLFDRCWSGFESTISNRVGSGTTYSSSEFGWSQINKSIEDLESAREKLKCRLSRSTDIFRFATVAWAFREYRNGELDESFLEALLAEYVIPEYIESPREISAVYFGLDFIESYQFDSWQHQDVSPTRQTFSFSSATGSWLLYYYSFIGPLVLAEADAAGEDIDNFDVEPSRSISARLNKIKNQIDTYQEEGLYRNFAQSVEVIHHRIIQKFVEAHENAAEEATQLELEEIREADIVPEKERAYKQESLDRFIDRFQLRSVLETRDRLTILTELNDLRTIKKLFAIPKSRFTDVQSFHMEVRTDMEPVIADVLTDFVRNSQLQTEPLRDYESLPDRILRGVGKLDAVPTGLVIAHPELRFGDYLENEHFQHPADVEDPPINGSVFADDVPVKFDPAIGEAGFSAIILPDIDNFEWKEFSPEGSPLKIEIIANTDDISEKLDQYNVDYDDLESGRPYAAVEYIYRYSTDPQVVEGMAINAPEGE